MSCLVIAVVILIFFQLMPYIDGFKHIARIAAEANIDISIVKSCLKNLVYVASRYILHVFRVIR